MPISGCHDLPLATFNLPSRVFRHGCRRAECPERRWGGFFHTLSRGGTAPHDHSCGQHTPDIGATSKEKNNIVIPEFSAWLTLVLEQCRAENIRNLPRQRAPTPLFPERRPREACSMPISGCHDLPLATFNLPSRVFRHGCRRAGCPERRWGGFFHTHSRGGMRGWPVHRPTHAPAIALKTNGNNAPPQNQKTLVPSLCGGMRV